MITQITHEPDLPDEVEGVPETVEAEAADADPDLDLDEEDEDDEYGDGAAGEKTYTLDDVRKLGASLGLGEDAVEGVIDDVMRARAAPSDPSVDVLAEDPNGVADPDALYDRVQAKVQELRDRRFARDQQVLALGLQDDLKQSAAELYAERLEKERNEALFVPTYPHAARSLIGRLLLRCEAGAASILDGDAFGNIDKKELGKASQLAHAISGLVRALNDIDPPTKNIRQSYSVNRSPRGDV